MSTIAVETGRNFGIVFGFAPVAARSKQRLDFSIATYNVLADTYIRRDYYQHSPDHLLEPSFRREALIDHLRQRDVDLWCLQEVECAAYTEIEHALAQFGYRGVFAKKGGTKPDGCACFYRTAVFELVFASRLEYDDGTAGQSRSGHIAQLLALRHRQGLLGLANTHLKWDRQDLPAQQRCSCRQVSQLLQEQRRQQRDCDGWILCGDLNATPDEALIAQIENSGMRDSHAGFARAYTANINGNPKKIDYLFHSAALHAAPIDLPVLQSDTPLPGPDQPSDHLALIARLSWA